MVETLKITKEEMDRLFTEKEPETVKLLLVRLAHDGSDVAMDCMRRFRKVCPGPLRGFFECAWDECSYFNFISKVDEISLQPQDAASMISANKLPQDQVDAECLELEQQLAEKGVMIDLVKGVPAVLRLAYVRNLSKKLDGMRYHGSGFVHFDGCTGSCDWCAQREWCDVARTAQC